MLRVPSSTGVRWLARHFAVQAKLNRQLRRVSEEEFFELARTQAKDMDLANVVVSLGRIAKMSDASSGLSDSAKTAELLLSSATNGLVASSSSWHSLTNLGWALCRLDVSDQLRQAVMDQILQRAMALGLETAPGRDLPVLLWALAMAQRQGTELVLTSLLKDLWRTLLLRLSEVPPQGLAMLLWSFAALDSDWPVPKQTYGAVLEQVEREIGQLKAREVANITWSVATVQAAMPTWLLEELPEHAAQFGPQECANVLWSLAVTAQVETMESLLPCLDGGVALADFSHWKPQEMASAAWALAIVLQRRPGQSNRSRLDLLGRLRQEAMAKVDELDGKELSMLSSALVPGEDDNLATRIMERAMGLHAKCQLAPDAVMQLRDHLHRMGMVCSLESAAEQLEDEALESLKKGDDVAAALQRLKLTCLGQRTESLLRRLGVTVGVPDEAAEDLSQAAAFGQVLCLVSYALQLGDESLTEAGRVVASGGKASGGVPLKAVILRYPRERDAEFLALSSVLETLSQVPAVSLRDVTGQLQLHVTHTPCLSCVWAMVQFREACPNVQLQVTFDSD